MKLVEDVDVLNRLAVIPGLTLPTSLKQSERITGYIEEASGVVMQKAGYEDAPDLGSIERSVLNGQAIRLAVLTILGDLYGTDPDMREAIRRERDAFLKELDAASEDDAGGGDEVFWEQA